MPKEGQYEWTFEEGIIDTAAILGIPYSRLYNSVTAAGLTKVRTEEGLQRTAVDLQQRGLSFAALVKVFGSEITLGELVKLEDEYRNTAIPAPSEIELDPTG